MNSISSGPPQIDPTSGAAIDGLDAFAETDMIEDIEESDDVEESEELSEERDKLRRRNNPRVRKKSPKSRSVALLQRDIEVRDLLKDSVKESAQKEAKQVKKRLQKQFQSELKQVMQDKIKMEAHARVKDTIALSKDYQMKEEISQKQRLEKNRKTDEISRFEKSLTAEKVAEEGLISDLDARNRRQKTDNEKVVQQKSATQSRDELLQKYVLTFAEDIVDNSPKKKEELKQLKQKLQSQGTPHKEIVAVESTAKKMIFSDLKKEIRKRFLKVSMSYDPKNLSHDLLSGYQGFKAITDMAHDMGMFGPGRDNPVEIKKAIKEEVKDFISDELDRSMIEVKLKTDDPKQMIKVFDSFNNIAGFAKFNPAVYMKHFYTKMDNFGLMYFKAPPKSGVVDLNNQKERKRKQHEPELPEDDPEDLEGALRRLYIESQLQRKPISLIKNKFERMKLERLMRKQGKENILEKLKKESDNISKMHFSFQLRDAFEERAVLPDHTGIPYKLIRSKIKKSLKGLKRLGHALQKTDVVAIRDQANRAMFTLIKEEYLKAEAHAKSSPQNRGLIRKKEAYIKVLQRLKKESNILESMNSKLLQDLSFLSDLNIVEAA